MTYQRETDDTWGDQRYDEEVERKLAEAEPVVPVKTDCWCCHGAGRLGRMLCLLCGGSGKGVVLR